MIVTQYHPDRVTGKLPRTDAFVVEMVGRGLAWMRMSGRPSLRDVTRYLRTLSLRLAREDLGHPRLLADFTGVAAGPLTAWMLVRSWVRDFPGLMDIRVAAPPLWVRMAVRWHRHLLSPGRSLEMVSEAQGVLQEELAARHSDCDESGICVFTGLSSHTRFEWLRYSLGTETTVGFRVIGDRILVGRPEGTLEGYNQDIYFKQRERVIGESSLRGRRFVEIRDFAATWGCAPDASVQAFYRRMMAEGDRLICYLVCNAPPELRARLEALPLRPPDRERLVVVETLSEALHLALLKVNALPA